MLRRRALDVRVVVLAAAALAVLAAVVVVATGGSGGGATDQDAARLVPDDALVYVHVSTDSGRDAVRRAQALAARFPGFARLRASILERLAVGGGGGAGAVGGWLGPEAALALTDSPSGTAGSLVVMAVRDEGRARAFVARGGRNGPSDTYRGVRIDSFGHVQAVFQSGFLVLGQPDTVRRAIDLAQGRGRSLAVDPRYARTISTLPVDRVVYAYASGDGIRRLLAPSPGLVGLVGTLLDRPGLRATALSLSAEAPGARLVAHSLLAPATRAPSSPFSPRLLSDVPAGVLGLLDVRGVTTALARLSPAAGGQSGGLAQLLAAVRAAIGAHPSPDVLSGLVAPLGGESAIVVTSGSPAPVLTVVAHTADVVRSRRALDALVAPLSRELRGLRVVRAQVAGRPVVTYRVASGPTISASAADGLLVFSTAPTGIAAVAARRGSVLGSAPFRAVVGDPARSVSSIAFLDFSQLLALGEQTGFGALRAFQSARSDLDRVRALGAVSTGSGEDTTSEVRLQIP